MPYIARVASGLAAGQFYGTYAGIAGMQDEGGGDLPAVSVILTEIAMYNGVTREDTTATATSTIAVDFGLITNANDGNVTDASLCGWVSTVGTYLNLHFATGYLFAAPPILDGVQVAGRSGGDGLGNCPDEFDVVQSVDGAYWALVDSGLTGLRPGSPNTLGPIVTFSTPTQPGAHRYWRLVNWDTHNFPDATDRNMELTEIALYEGIVDKTSMATVTTPMTFAIGSLATWLDGDTTGASVAEVLFANLGPINFDFGSAVAINAIRIAPDDDDDKWPYQVELHYSDNGTDYTFAGKAYVNPYPGNNTLTPIFRLF